MMRGVAIGKFDTTELGLESGRSEARTLVEQLGLGLGNGKPKGAQRLFWEGRVCHGAIRRTNCEAPTVVAKNLFAFAGLSWDPQTAAFLEASTTYAGPTDTIKYSRIRANRRTPGARIFLKPSKDEFLILSVMSQRGDYLRNKRAVEQQSYRPSLRQVAPIRYPEWPRSYPECHGMYLDHLREGITNIVDAIGNVTNCRIFAVGSRSTRLVCWLRKRPYDGLRLRASCPGRLIALWLRTFDAPLGVCSGTDNAD